MRQATCSRCNATVPLQKTYVSHSENYCETCAQTVANEAKASGQAATFARNLDASICALCGKDNPSGADFGFRKKLPFCETCGPKVERWPYPQWLKLSLAALVLLLAVSLIRGRTYFHAGRELYLGERLVRNLKYQEALPHLKEAVRIAPGSDKAVLLLAKAALHIGDVATADKALQGHNGGRFEDAQDENFVEMKLLWDRAMGAFEKVGKARQLAEKEGSEEEVAKLMREAASQYPEGAGLKLGAREADAGVAFTKKDYDTFLVIEQEAYSEHEDSESASRLASALACKYAVTGDVDFKQESEGLLARAEQLAQSDPEEKKSFEEYAPRIRYRLESRQIFTKQEYDKKFRSSEQEKTKK